MNKQDANGVRSARDLERKYDFSALLGLQKNVKIQVKALLKVQNELNNFISTTINSLEDMSNEIDGKITTWYYEGIPELTNYPANEWKDIQNHVGDLYYDKLTGYCYRFQYENDTYYWNKIIDKDVIESMALASSAKDTADSKRQVFVSQPVVPYDTGDLWVNEKEIYICQVSRKEGNFNENDWINNLKYTDNTVAEAVDNKVTVLSGTVREITESYVKYTDLATGGSTTIAGENITTGSIQSSNYISKKSGTKIDLLKGTIDTKNTKIDEYGNLLMNNGAEIITDKGLRTNMQFFGRSNLNGSSDFANVGIYNDTMNSQFVKSQVAIYADIPENFNITEAYVTFIHQPVFWSYLDNNQYMQELWGWTRAIGLYKSTMQSYHNAIYGSEFYTTNETKTEIVGAFGASGWTAAIPGHSSAKVETKKSINIYNQLETGKLNKIILETRNNLPTYSSSDYFNNVRTECANSGRLMAILNILGYKK